MAKPGRPAKLPAHTRPEWARRLRAEREIAGYTSQEAFAVKAGKSQSTYGEYETGKTEPDLATWCRMADALGVSPGWLAFGAGRRLPNESDAAALRAVEAHQDDGRLYLSVCLLAQMLAEEEFGANLRFLLDLATKIAKAAEGAEDQLEARERIRRAVETERQEIREGLAEFRKSRL